MAQYEEDGELAAEAELPVFEPEPDETAHGRQDGPDPRLTLAVKVLKQVHESLGHVVGLLEGGEPEGGARRLAQLVTAKRDAARQADALSGTRMVEGVFDGISMVGSDGNVYAIPPNYASKSRLVEGDVLKLTIKPDGTFVYKQIGPAERRRLVGCLAFDASSDSHVVLCGPAVYKVLGASVSFFKGQPGDETVVLVPKSAQSVWAAVENIVKK